MTEETPVSAKEDVISLTADIVAAYVGNNTVATADLAGLIQQIHTAVQQLATGAQAPVEQVLAPAVPIKKSVTPDYVVCLEDGKKFKSLKRHLRTSFDLTPDQYRKKWSLPHDYPMVAPNYAATRSKLAKSIGLGNLRQKAKLPIAAKKGPASARKSAAKKTPATGKSGPKPVKKSAPARKAAKGK